MATPFSTNDPFPTKADATSRWRRTAIGVSIVFHGMLLFGLAVWYVGRPRASDTPTSVAAAAPAAANRSPESPPPQPAADVNTQQVAATLQRATEYFDAKPDEEKLSELEKQALKLEQVASEQSVDEIAQKFHAWMSTASRAGQPAAEPVAGEFDFDTAQIHEVRRETSVDGPPVYYAVLVDAAGRTLETDMPPDEGERAYATLEKLREFPLADKVYRQIAMPLIDKAIAAGEKTSPPPPSDDNDRDPFDDSP